MKLLLVFTLLLSFFIQPVSSLTENASSAILLNYDTNEVLYEKDAKVKKFPASTTKIMTLILIFEKINDGQLKLKDNVTASKYASSMGGSQIYLKEGEVMSVEDLLKSIILASANDACVAMAEYICGTSDLFVEEMNKKAKKLKLENTHFMNCTGLHDDNHYTCAYDLAKMTKYLLDIGKETLFKYTLLKEDYIRNNEFWLVNTNKLLSKSDIITGLKTGYTKEAKYCLVSTAKKNNQTLISVVLDEPKSNIRNEEALELINYGFSLYKTHTLFKKADIIDTLSLPYTKEKQIPITTNKDINISVKKDETFDGKYKIVYFDYKEFKTGDHVGNLVYQNQEFPLYATTDATKLSYLDKMIELFKKLI